MFFHNKTIRNSFFFFQHTAWKFKGPITLPAMKMVMMPFFRPFIQHAKDRV